MEPPESLEKGLDHTGIDEDWPERAQKEFETQHRREGLIPSHLYTTAREDRPRRKVQTARNLAIILFVAAILWFSGRLIPLVSSRFRHGLCDKNQPSHTHSILEDDFTNVVTRPEDLANDSRILHQIPQYVLDYAPLVHLYSEEQFWPCDIAEHLFHVTPELNYTPIQGRLQYSNLTNLDSLNDYENGRHVYLTSNDNVEERPEWLGGQKNIPDEFREDMKDSYPEGPRAGMKSNKLNDLSRGGRSDAPAVLITIDKGHGIVDAFWFFFYSYNLGNKVFNIRFGNHVGDWEHSLVRFHHGKPKLVFVSEHFFGEAYTYEAVEKIGKRPVVYSATGTHAMYATPGTHPYILPLGILHDETDRGPLWDPVLNSHMYTYNHLTDDLKASNVTPHAPTEWFFFNGKWGDKSYPMDDNRQYGIVGEYHYVSGPLGPRFKHLGRRKICQGSYDDPCEIKDRLDAVNELKIWPGMGDGEAWPNDPEMRPPNGIGD